MSRNGKVRSPGNKASRMIRVDDVEPRPELALLTIGELCYIIGAILMQPGDGFTEQELDELAAINAEIVRRERIKQ